MKPNYDVHKKEEVDAFINNIVIEKYLIAEQLDYNIYGRKPTIISK